MKESKYQQLRKSIVSAVPEIMALKKGCEIEYLNFGEKTKAVVVKYDKSIKPSTFTVFEYSDNEVYSFFEDADNIRKLKIIGRDITPIDILKTRKDLSIDGCGGIFIRNFCLNTSLNCNKKGDLWEMEYCGHYDLNKPFQDQSDECKDLLWDLIVKK